MSAAAVLAELRARGVRAYPRGDKLRLEPLEALTPELIERARAVRDELLRLLSEQPDPNPDLWVVSSASGGDMRVVTTTHPSEWPPLLYRCGALIEVLDERTRADRADARAIADELEALLATLRRQGVEVWVSS
jgi:hypothetical protein